MLSASSKFGGTGLAEKVENRRFGRRRGTDDPAGTKFLGAAPLEDIENCLGISEGRLMRWLSRCVPLLAVAAVVWGALGAPAHANSKYAAYVVHADSGDVFFDRYSTLRRYPASLTKMMTLYLLFEEMEAGKLSSDSELAVSARAAGQPPSKLGVKAGETIDVDTAIKALVVKSANDVAVVVAEQIAGSEWRFAQEMTAKARELGMRNTTFRNASGLPNSKQITTALDMAILGRRLVQDFPQYFDYFAANSFSWDGKTYSSHNSLVKSYDGADGIKTGYTRMSGFNLVTTVERDGQRLIGVVMGGRSSYTRDRHMRQILDEAYAAIAKKPTLIAALYRATPEPRLKPTLVARLAAVEAAPTVAGNDDLRREILMASSQFELGEAVPVAADELGALIAATDTTEDFNEFERTRMASLNPNEAYAGEGDRELNEYKWGVQIGAYSSKALAQKELETAAFKAGLIDRARAVLPTALENGKTLYRARLMKLSEIEAAASCAALRDKGIQCFIVSDADTAVN